MRYTIIESPIGDLIITRDDIGITGVYLPEGRNAIKVKPEWTRDDAAFEDARTQFAEYFAGTRRAFDVEWDVRPLPAFNQRVLAQLARVEYGTTTTYGELAAVSGNPKAARAVGTVMNRNPIPIVLPCHRVVGANGSLTGYGGGLDRKEWLLRLEGALL